MALTLRQKAGMEDFPAGNAKEMRLGIDRERDSEAGLENRRVRHPI